MNTIRMIAVALPVMLLMACGGGGGGGTASAPTTPPTNMPGTGDPMNPPTTTPTVMLETLPGYAVVPATARTRVGGAAPTAANTMSETAIVTEIQRIATAADTFGFSDFGPTASAVTVTCSNKSCTTGNIVDVGTLTFSLAGIDDLSLVDETGLVGFNSNTEAVMVDRGATLIQSQAAGRQSDGTQLAFQTYGGWIDDSVFGVELLNVTENGTTTSRFASFSFGNDHGSRPPGNEGPAFFNGSMVGVNASKEIIQGDAQITIDLSRQNHTINVFTFNNIVNISSGSNLNDMTWNGISVATDGTFSSTSQTTGDVNGAFYGDGSVAGGTFNRDNIIGAFGVKK